MSYQKLNLDDVGSMLFYEEGFRDTLYRDINGYWTIGVGFCLDKIRMPEKVAMFWLNCIIEEILEQLENTEDIYRIFEKLDESRQMGIINMCYQMGVRGVHGFHDMWAALDKDDYKGSARAAKDSDWGREFTARSDRVAEVLEKGNVGEVYDLA